jgi:hypothetical protein
LVLHQLLQLVDSLVELLIRHLAEVKVEEALRARRHGKDVEGFQVPPGAVHPCQAIILGVPIDGLAGEDLLDEQLDPQHLQCEQLAQDLLRGIGRAAEVGGVLDLRTQEGRYARDICDGIGGMEY